MHILIAEDQDNVRKAECRALARMGYIVTDARGGHEAAAIFKRTEEIRVVVSDFDMNDEGNGRELYEAIAEDLAARGGLFLVVTGGIPNLQRQWFESQGVAVLWKPPDYDDIRRRINALQ
ncbi:MAG: response regulator [Patescibacteria group bacterium]